MSKCTKFHRYVIDYVTVGHLRLRNTVFQHKEMQCKSVVIDKCVFCIAFPITGFEI